MNKRTRTETYFAESIFRNENLLKSLTPEAIPKIVNLKEAKGYIKIQSGTINHLKIRLIESNKAIESLNESIEFRQKLIDRKNKLIDKYSDMVGMLKSGYTDEYEYNNSQEIINTLQSTIDKQDKDIKALRTELENSKRINLKNISLN
jgi:predicted RNase H-like nuclease (RuvC/YqgF family)